MPKIHIAIHEGPLGGSERAVMRTVANHPFHIWSTSPEDLVELALMTANPELGDDVERYFPQAPIDRDFIFDVPTSFDDYGQPIRFVQTYRLSTIRWALSRLASKQRIAAFTLHGRRYYGSFQAFEKVQDFISNMDQAALDRSGFSPMTTTELDTGDELTGDAAVDSIGKP